MKKNFIQFMESEMMDNVFGSKGIQGLIVAVVIIFLISSNI